MKITFEIPDDVFNSLVDSVCVVDGYKQNDDETKVQFTKRRLLEDWAFRKIALAKSEKAKKDAIDAFTVEKATISNSITILVAPE